MYDSFEDRPITFASMAARLRVISALMLRETRARFGESRFGYAWALVEPISHVGVMSFVYWAINRQAPVGSSEELFFVTGVLPFFLYQKTALHLGGVIRSNIQLLRLPVVRTTDLIVARAALEALTWVTVSVIIFTGLVVVGQASAPNDPLQCAMAAVATFALGFGIGMMNSVLMALWKTWVVIYVTISRPLYHFSAIFFFIDRVPDYLRAPLSWNPLVHSVQWFRVGYNPEYASQVLDREYLIKWAVAVVLLGLCMERIAQSRLAAA